MKDVINVMAIWSILLPFRMFYGHLVYFVVILAYLPTFWYFTYTKKKSGNPEFHALEDC
jgi:hypothetical protein